MEWLPPGAPVAWVASGSTREQAHQCGVTCSARAHATPQSQLGSHFVDWHTSAVWTVVGAYMGVVTGVRAPLGIIAHDTSIFGVAHHFIGSPTMPATGAWVAQPAQVETPKGGLHFGHFGPRLAHLVFPSFPFPTRQGVDPSGLLCPPGGREVPPPVLSFYTHVG